MQRPSFRVLFVQALISMSLVACLTSASADSGAAGAATDVQVKAQQQSVEPEYHDQPEALQEPAVEIRLDGPVEAGELPADDNSAGILLIGQAVQRALAANPKLAAQDKEYLALDSIAWQEGRKPNPGLELEFEEFGGTQDALGVRSLTTALTYTQAIERGGKRSKREIAAALEREVILWDIAELEHEIQAGVRSAYAAVQAAQFELHQLRQYRDLVQRIKDTVAVSVEAGRRARLELERFAVELSRIDLEVAMAERRLDQAMLELAATWGGSEAGFDSVSAVSDEIHEIPELAQLLPWLEQHPALLRYDSEYEALCALVDLENANAIPDLEISGGIARLNEINETVFSVGVAMELPVNDKNEGNISAAARRLEQVEDYRAASRLELESKLAVLRRQAAHALLNYQAYGARLLPAANEALALTEEGYRYGKFELLDVLDAQRTVLELEGEQTAAWIELYLQLTALEALLNADLAELIEPAEQQTFDSAAAPQVIEQLNNEDHGNE